MSVMNNTSSHEQDTVRYLECVIRNDDPQTTKVAEFNQTLTAPMLNKASDYYCLIQSFSIERTALPIFTYLDNFIITFERLGIDYIEVVPYLNRGVSLGGDNGVYNLFQFTDMINASLTNLHTLSGASGSVGTGAPFLRYEPNTANKFTFYIPTGYDGDIFFNAILDDLFTFDTEYYGLGTNKTAEIRNVATPFNQETVSGTDYNVISNQDDSLWRFNDIRGVIVTTNTLPITKEIISFGNESNYISTNVMQRFFEIINIGEGVQPVPLEYVSEYDNYLIDLISPQPLNNIGFRVDILYKNDTVRPLILQPFGEASLKLKFIKKSFYFNRAEHENKLTPNIGMKQFRR